MNKSLDTEDSPSSVPELTLCAQGVLGRWVDKRLEPLMRFISGAPKEAPQKTHFWNNHHLREEDISHLNRQWMVVNQGDMSSRKLPQVHVLAGILAHVTIWGGWRHYVVVTPESDTDWHVGWHWPGGVGLSRISARGPVRVLIPPNFIEWFGVDASTYLQIPLRQIGEGWIGDGGDFSHLPLF